MHIMTRTIVLTALLAMSSGRAQSQGVRIPPAQQSPGVDATSGHVVNTPAGHGPGSSLGGDNLGVDSMGENMSDCPLVDGPHTALHRRVTAMQAALGPDHNAPVLVAMEEQFSMPDGQRAIMDSSHVTMSSEGMGMQSGRIRFLLPRSARSRGPMDPAPPPPQSMRLIESDEVKPENLQHASCYFRFATPLSDCMTTQPARMQLPALRITDCVFDQAAQPQARPGAHP